jgi:hypothetical protein
MYLPGEPLANFASEFEADQSRIFYCRLVRLTIGYPTTLGRRSCHSFHLVTVLPLRLSCQHQLKSLQQSHRTLVFEHCFYICYICAI